MGALSDHSCTKGGPQSNHQILGGNGQLNGAAESRIPLLPGYEKLHNPAKHRWKYIIISICTILGIGVAIVAVRLVYVLTVAPSGSDFPSKTFSDQQHSSPGLPDVTSVSQPWIQNGTWEYLFSDIEVTWNESQRICSSHGASLVTLDTPEEREFIENADIVRESWIDLRRESPGEPWRYSNGTVFDNRFEILNEKDSCAYWTVYHISSTRCYRERCYVCRRRPPKPE